MSLNIDKLSEDIVSSMMNVVNIDGVKMGDSLNDMATKLGLASKDDLPQYINMQLTWNRVVTEIVNHIQGNMEVKLAAEIDELKTLISSWVPAAGDGGALLKTTLTTWISSDTDNGVE